MQVQFVAAVLQGLSNRDPKKIAEDHADAINEYLKGFHGDWSYKEVLSERVPPLCALRAVERNITGSWSPNIARSNAVINPLRKTLKNRRCKSGVPAYSYVFATPSQTRAHLKLLKVFESMLDPYRHIVSCAYPLIMAFLTAAWTLGDEFVFSAAGAYQWMMLTVIWAVIFFILWNR